MFANACDSVSKFTHPLVVSSRRVDGSVGCSLGSFIWVNKDGWALSVAHIFGPFLKYQEDAPKLKLYHEEKKRIEVDEKLDPKQKRKKTDRLSLDREWITNFSVWWGGDGISHSVLKVNPALDLAIAKLSPVNSTTFPVFKNPINIRPGTSLCKLGYPLYQVKASFNEANNSFVFAPGTLPVPRFPIEGIYTRNILAGKTPDQKFEMKFIETSSPGLKGQSGGPVFDVNGNVWGIQSRTSHFPLGFSPKVKKNGKEIEENQFLNAGWAVHPEVIIKVLGDLGVQFELSQES